MRKQEYTRECRELGGRSAKVEQIFLRIWGVDDSHLEGRIPETQGQASPTMGDDQVTRCDDLAIEDEEREEMEHAIAAIANTIRDSPLTGGRTVDSASERDRYTAFAPLASAYWVEHTSTGFRHAIWKMETFNHVAPISIRALQFLGNITDAQVKDCRTQELKGKLKFSGRVPPLDPQDLKFPPMHAFDPDKCGETSFGMWQKAIWQQDRLDPRNMRNIWSVGRPYLKCKCKKEKNKDCGDTPLWFDHALWFLLAHPDVLFSDMSSIKIRTSMLIHYLRITWREGILAAIAFHFIRDLMMGFIRELENDATLDTEGLLKDDRLWNYPILAMLARIMLPTRIPEKPTRFPLSSPRVMAWKRNAGVQIPGQTTLNFRRVTPMITLPTGRRSWKRQKSDCDVFLHLKYTSRVMEPFSIRKMVNEILARIIGDDTATWLECTMIGWTYNASIASRLCRPVEVFCDFDVAQWMEVYDPELCPCRSRRYADMRNPASLNLLQSERHTHVIMLDSSITDNPLLQGIINSGLNHIPCMALDVDVAENEVGDFLDRLMTRVLELRELTASSQSFLRRVILRRARAKMSKYKEQHRHVSVEPFEHSAVKRELEFLVGRFLICPTHKAPNTPVFVCKNFIRKLAFHRLSGPEFASIAAPPAAVVTRIQGGLSAFPALPMAPLALPYLMAVFKAHKGAFRWITNTVGIVISPAADLCACLMRFLLPLVQTFCQERSLEMQEQYGVRPNLWWSIASVGEFCANLTERIFFVFTADITKCFETIPTDNSEDGLPATVRFYVQSAMRVRRERSSCHIVQIRLGDDGKCWPSWVDADEAEGMGTMLFKEEDICWLSDW
ncbi:hypothetical protein CBR_g29316 [Chara braunii]|uniref:Uncharacterized protein n=1 Tax=Chara braunii TaxID=69332 RepID=A0A388JWE5_CHABU|nr:hypothetical protein CBR_g29316 [Chara braunii]|eukprot:GBG62116.1 hypothetical protein CBR_g29316 [Chara braunii]